jgi:hypothetical protein
MSRRGNADNEIAISAWSPAWIDGSGVSRVAAWFMATSQDWRTSKILEIDRSHLSSTFDVVRTSGHASPRADLSHPSPITIPVVHELSRFRKGKGKGQPLEERIVEHAASVIPCPIGLHAIDIRRPLPEGALMGTRGNHPEVTIREWRAEFRAFCTSLSPSWAICSTFGRGPSIVELYRKSGSPAQIGAVYVSKAVPIEELEKALQPAYPMDIGDGFEITLSQRLGGPMNEIPTSTYDELWRILGKASMIGLPWQVLKDITSHR